MKKAQFEILGLAIAVVLVSVIVLFLVSLSIGDSQEDLTSVFQQDQFTQNLLDAYLKASHPACPDRSAARYFVWNVTGAGSAQCRDPATWDELNRTLDTAITQYIGRDYNFTVREKPCDDPFACNTPIAITSGNCNPETQGSSRAGRQTLTKHPRQGNIEITLWLCQAQ